MAEPVGNQGKLYTLSEISQKSGISMPTLQRYKKMYQARIPAEGKGRKQRYPESALPVFEEIRNENLGRRGRPRKDPNAPRPVKSTRGRKPAAKPAAKAAAAPAPAAAPARRGRPPGKKSTPAAAAPARRGRPPAAKPAAAAPAKPAAKAKLLTLTEISKQAKISYPTLVRYVRMHLDRLPHEGKGRARRFYQEAVEIFRELRGESGRGGRKPAAAAQPAAKRRGRPPGSGKKAAAAPAAQAGADPSLLQRLREIEKSHLDLEKRFRELGKGLQKFFR